MNVHDYVEFGFRLALCFVCLIVVPCCKYIIRINFPATFETKKNACHDYEQKFEIFLKESNYVHELSNTSSQWEILLISIRFPGKRPSTTNFISGNCNLNKEILYNFKPARKLLYNFLTAILDDMSHFCRKSDFNVDLNRAKFHNACF